MNLSTSTPITPTLVRAYFLAHFPAEELPGIFFEVSSQSLLHSIAAFFSGAANRPSCTLENIVATVRYPHIAHVLTMLSTDPDSDAWVLQLQATLTRQAVLQVAAVISFIDIILAHIHPEEQEQRRVHAFINAFAA